MQIPSNIVRFPVPAPTSEGSRRAAAGEQRTPDNVVAFVPPMPDVFSPGLLDYGKLFAAHRISSRVSDDLDAAAVL